jgi:hypothetical protein
MTAIEPEPSKLRSAPLKNWYGTQEALDALVIRTLADLPKLLAYEYSVLLTQVLIRTVEDGWQVILKADNRDGPVVSYVWGDGFVDALEMTAFLIDKGTLDWKPDKYPPKYR